MEEYKITDCPFCGAKNSVFGSYYSDGGLCLECSECERLFDLEDYEREDIRHKVSVLLNGTDEEHPKKCDIIVGEWEAQGLSSLELPHIVKCFQIPGDGTMWFHCDGAVDENGEEAWMNFDDFDIHDLREILVGLQEQDDYPDIPDKYPDEIVLEAESNRAETEYFNR